MSVATQRVPEQGAAALAWAIGSIGATASYAPNLESALFTALLDQDHLGVGVCDPDGVLTLLNPALEEMLGQRYVPAAQPTWPHRYHFHDEDGRPLGPGDDPLARALRGETVAGQLVCVRPPRRAARYLRCSALQLRDADGDLLAAVVLAVDVTEQARLDHLRDRLVSSVNHEVRTPLAVIMGHLELIRDLAGALPEELAWSIDAIERASGHLGDVVDKISQIADESLAGPRRKRSWIRGVRRRV